MYDISPFFRVYTDRFMCRNLNNIEKELNFHKMFFKKNEYPLPCKSNKHTFNVFSQ